MRINVGCGQTPTNGWRNFDNSPSLRLAKIPFLTQFLFKLKVIDELQFKFIEFARSNSIEYGDATRGLPLGDGSVEVLYSSHMIEHLDRTEVSLFLNEARRVLGPGGIIRIAIPDLQKHVSWYLQSGDSDAFIERMLICQPKQKGILLKLKYLFVGARNHQWMYDGKALCSLLAKHGFRNPEIMEVGSTGIHDPVGLNLRERAGESLYVKARAPETD